MIRILTLVAGLAGAAGLSQFPAFSQQYLQRLAGAVDELTRVVADFDASAAGVGMSRDQALAALSEGDFQQARQADMRRTIGRAERLSADLDALREASMVARALQPQRFTDAEIAAAAWRDFEPAMPVTATGAGFAGMGVVLGAGLFGGLLRLLRLPFRRRDTRKSVQIRQNRAVSSAGRSDSRPRIEPVLAGGGAVSPRPALPVGWLARTNAQPRKMVQTGHAVQVAVLAVPASGDLEGRGGDAFDLILVCLEGQGEAHFGSECREIAAGEMVSLPPGTAYRLVNLGDGPLRLFTVEPRTGAAVSEDTPARLENT